MILGEKPGHNGGKIISFLQKNTLTIWINIYQLNELGRKSANSGEQ